MFGNVWELKKMYEKYKKLQDALKNIVIRAKDNWVMIDITGEMKIKDVKIEDETLLTPANKAVLENAIKTCFMKWQQKAQEVVAEKTKEILGFDPNDIANMMWWWALPNTPM